jgi:hypothetical protein
MTGSVSVVTKAAQPSIAALAARHRNRRRFRNSMVILLISAGSVGTLLASAVFTDTQSIGGNTFSTGTIDISSSPTTALATYSAMAPGDKVTSPITITNNGSLQLRYAVTSTTTENVLASQLDLVVKSGVTTCSNAGFGADGTVLYAAGDLGATGTTALIGDASQGAQAGDRTLDAGAHEVLCFQVSLPTGSSNSFQGLSDTATFAFLAEQTANN